MAAMIPIGIIQIANIALTIKVDISQSGCAIVLAYIIRKFHLNIPIDYFIET